MNAYEEFLATLEEIEQSASGALESANFDPGEKDTEIAEEGLKDKVKEATAKALPGPALTKAYNSVKKAYNAFLHPSKSALKSAIKGCATSAAALASAYVNPIPLRSYELEIGRAPKRYPENFVPDISAIDEMVEDFMNCLEEFIEFLQGEDMWSEDLWFLLLGIGGFAAGAMSAGGKKNKLLMQYSGKYRSSYTKVKRIYDAVTKTYEAIKDESSKERKTEVKVFGEFCEQMATVIKSELKTITKNMRSLTRDAKDNKKAGMTSEQVDAKEKDKKEREKREGELNETFKAAGKESLENIRDLLEDVDGEYYPLFCIAYDAFEAYYESGDDFDIVTESMEGVEDMNEYEMSAAEESVESQLMKKWGELERQNLEKIEKIQKELEEIKKYDRDMDRYGDGDEKTLNPFWRKRKLEDEIERLKKENEEIEKKYLKKINESDARIEYNYDHRTPKSHRTQTKERVVLSKLNKAKRDFESIAAKLEKAKSEKASPSEIDELKKEYKDAKIRVEVYSKELEEERSKKSTEGYAESDMDMDDVSMEGVEDMNEYEMNAAEEASGVEEQVETPVEEPKAEFETPEVEEIEVPDENVLTTGNESLLLLDCLYATSTPEEFKSFLSDNKIELELYGLVDTDAIARESWADVDADESEVATEARNIVRLNREAQISRETARIAIGLAKQANDSLYKYYHKYSSLKREFRDKIYAKYGQRAQALARRSLTNSRAKAAMMNSRTGTSIVNKIDSRIKQLDSAGRNKEAIQK